MNHFSSEVWLDFARLLLSPEERMALEGHLDADCPSCRADLAFWKLVVEVAAGERAFDPPAESVREIEAAYRIFPHASRLRQFADTARLIFDSFLQPSFAFVRAAAAAPRQLIHESDPFTIDIRLEPDASRKEVYLTGQVVNAQDVAEIAESIDVVLLRGSEQVAKTQTSGSGEFALQLPTGSDLELFLNIRGQRPIAIPLPPTET